MNASELTPPSAERILALVRGELSPTRRWCYRLLLLVVSVLVAAILSLWTTEPGPLPLRLHVGFAACVAIGCGWIGVLSWILTRRSCPTALDRLATSWMATVACLLFVVVAVPIALLRGEPGAAMSLGVLGLALVAAALYLLRTAYALRTRLRTRLAELEGCRR